MVNSLCFGFDGDDSSCGNFSDCHPILRAFATLLFVILTIIASLAWLGLYIGFSPLASLFCGPASVYFFVSKRMRKKMSF